MCGCANVIRLKINNYYKYLSTNITTTRKMTKLHEIETNLQFVAQPGPEAKLINKSNTALAKANERLT